MTARPFSSDPVETAALYVSGALSPDEVRQVEAALEAGDTALAEAIAQLEPIARGLMETIESVTPSDATREAVLRAAREKQDDKKQVWRDWMSDDPTRGFYTLLAGEGAWEPTGVPGIEVRRLFVDRESDRLTCLFRMEPGSKYVPHVHDGPEECFVLEGDLHVGDELVMRAGDYQRAAPGSLHQEQWTENGCVILVTSSLHDEVV